MESSVYALIGCIITILLFLLFRPVFLWYFKIPDIINNQMKIINNIKRDESTLQLSERSTRDTNQTSIDDEETAELKAFMRRMNQKNKQE